VIAARLAGASIGIALMAAPAILDASDGHSVSMHVAGPLALALSVAATAPALASLRWGLVPVGAWLVIAPVILGGPVAAAVASFAAGVVLILLAFVGPVTEDERGGGWRAVLLG
jgi:hypothetical protein